MPMHIQDITTSIKNIPLKTPFVTALRRVESVAFIRVEVLYSNGAVSYGEAPATKAITGETLESIRSEIDEITPKLLGVKIDEALALLHQEDMGSSAKAALDIALCEHICSLKIDDKSPIKTDVTISLGSTKKMLADAQKAYDEGMDILKVKLGQDISHAIEVTEILSQRVPHAKLLIDANQAWSYEDASSYIEATSKIALELIEQPVVAEDLESLAKLSRISDIPIMADEAVFTLQDLKRVVELEAADMINIKLMKCGGVSKAIEMLEYAREHNIECMLGSMLEGPYSINSTIYLAFAYRDVVMYVDLDSPLLYKELPQELDFNYNGATVTFKDQ